jgi:hypothetical protein
MTVIAMTQTFASIEARERVRQVRHVAFSTIRADFWMRPAERVSTSAGRRR